MNARIVIPALMWAIVPSMIAAESRYEKIDLSGAPGHTVRLLGLNERGQVLGSDCVAGAETCDLFVWTDRDGKRVIGVGAYGFLNNEGHVARARTWSYPTMVDLWTEQTGWQNIPGMTSIGRFNDNDMIYGAVDSRAGLWTPRDGFTPIVPPQNRSFSMYAMNNGGVLVGGLWWTACTTPPCYEHPAAWSPSTGVLDLGELPGLPRGQAGIVNDKGNIGGYLLDPEASLKRHLFFWTARNGIEDLGECLACAPPQALNKHDELAGRAYTTAIRTYFWSRKTGLFDIGTLGGRGAGILGMNDRGEIVGESADPSDVWSPFVWSRNDGMVNLTPGESGTALRINNDGLIIGSCKTQPCAWKRVSGR